MSFVVPDPYKFDPIGFTIFCDDIRDEKSNKTILVGVYGDVMFSAQTMPVALPSFHMLIHLFATPGDIPEKLIVRVALPGEEVEKASLLVDVDKATFEEPVVIPDYGDVLTHPRSHFVLRIGAAPFVLPKHGRIRVSALWDDKFIPLGSLAIVPPTSPS